MAHHAISCRQACLDQFMDQSLDKKPYTLDPEPSIFCLSDLDVCVEFLQGCLGDMPQCDAVQLLVDRSSFFFCRNATRFSSWSTGPLFSFGSKPVEQKLLVDGLLFVLQLLVDSSPPLFLKHLDVCLHRRRRWRLVTLTHVASNASRWLISHPTYIVCPPQGKLLRSSSSSSSSSVPHPPFTTQGWRQWVQALRPRPSFKPYTLHPTA